MAGFTHAAPRTEDSLAVSDPQAAVCSVKKVPGEPTIDRPEPQTLDRNPHACSVEA